MENLKQGPTGLNRRNVFKKMLLTTGALAGAQLLRSNAFAQVATAECALVQTKIDISNNHGHELHVSLLDALDGAEKTYSIQAQSGHDHLIVISKDDFKKLRLAQAITLISSDESGHSHQVVVKILEKNLNMLISSNHGHIVNLSSQQILMGDAVQVPIQGQSSHNHIVQFTEEHLRQIRLGKNTTIQSSTEAGHSHSVSVQAAFI